jgi:hypothetical protein
MNYTKPEITSLASASFVIQGYVTKGFLLSCDALLLVFKTPAAYEADE